MQFVSERSMSLISNTKLQVKPPPSVRHNGVKFVKAPGPEAEIVVRSA